MGIAVVLDTNVFINVKNKEEPYYPSSKKILDWIDEGRMKGIVSTIVVAEMCSGFYEADEIREKEDFLTHISGSQTYQIKEVSLSIADEAGRIRSSKGLRLPDSIIVATGLREGAKYLATNDDSFKKARDLIGVFTPKELVRELDGSVRRERKKN